MCKNVQYYKTLYSYCPQVSMNLPLFECVWMVVGFAFLFLNICVVPKKNLSLPYYSTLFEGIRRFFVR